MASPRPARRRLPIFVLAATVLSAAFTLSDTALVTASSWTTSLPVVIVFGETLEQAGIVLLALPLGVLIDRARRRSVLVLTALLGAVAVTSVAAVGAFGGFGWPDWPLLLTATTATGVLASVAAIGQDAYLPSVVRRGRLLPANALLTLLPRIAVLPIALTVLDWPGPGFALAVGLTLVAAAALVRRVPAVERPPPPRAGLWRETAEGIRFTARHPALRAIALCLLLSSLLSELDDGPRGTAFRDLSGANVELARWLSLYAPYVLGALVAVLLHRRLGAFRLAWCALLVSGPLSRCL